MAMFATKHRPMPRGSEPETISGHVGTLLDDMKVQKYVCLPQKPQVNRVTSIQFGTDAPVWRSLRQQDFAAPSVIDREPPEVKAARARDMNDKHFDFGDDDRFYAPPRMQPPTRDQLLARDIRPIGGPNNKGQSNLFPGDVDRWPHDVVSTYRRDFLKPDAPRADPSKEIPKMMGSTHFVLGEVEPEWKTTQQDFVPTGAPPPARAVNENSRSAVPLAGETVGRPITMTQADYGPPGAPEVIPPVAARDTNLVFGYDDRELKTTQRGSYKQPRYIDCEAYTDEELKALGLVRFLLTDVPADYKENPQYKEAIADWTASHGEGKLDEINAMRTVSSAPATYKTSGGGFLPRITPRS
eukprot:NODE_301_length_1653_cov_290.644638_g225_i0.p1 GENE.NODE_301_length_1653_cov_290.644638_g225_i0~~NODE_301_length_1653_cov_290.644638_g225_i0.p1  ORF type:complete len:355 (+),score=38.46 NODE_301_length_1653_cov_290.644638_g225_i0:126-1190(+)